MIDSTVDGAGGAPDLKRTPRRKPTTNNGPKLDRLPPHSPEAEQGVLGCILLAPNDCIGQCIEKFKGGEETFYDLRHQTIFKTLAEMFDTREAIDVITLQQRLKDKQLLDAVGGIPYLSALPDVVPSAANLSYYLDIVQEKYLLRKVISVCTDVVGRVYDFEGEVDGLMDEVERDILRISESRVQANTNTMKDLVFKAITTIESFHQRQGTLTGVPTGFVDLDKMTNGFHGGEMIVIAARPSMGKCLAYDSEILLADGSVSTIEEIYQRRNAKLLTLNERLKFETTLPSAYVDDGRKPVFRVVTRLGRQVEATLPHPFLTVRGWTKLAELKPGERIAVPRQLTVFGNETARECDLKLLAYLLGDGCLTDSSPSFSNGNAQLRADFAEAVDQFGGVRAQPYDSNGTRTASLRVAADPEFIRSQRNDFGQRLCSVLDNGGQSSRQVALASAVSPVSLHEWKAGHCVPGEPAFGRLCKTLNSEPSSLAPQGIQAISANSKNAVTRWLEELGVWNKAAAQKFIPGFVFRLTRPQLALFLNRLFATDGWATVLASGQAQLGYATVSEKLSRQIQHLLLRFGIVAALKPRRVLYQGSRRPAWQLDITDSRSIATFISELGMFGKERALAAVQSAVAKKHYQTNRDLVPVEIWNQVTEAKGQESWAGLARRAGLNSTNLHVGRRAPTRHRLSRLAQALESQPLQDVAESDIYWDEIVAIEPVGKKQVYDLTIAQHHNFVANDVCVHNTSLAMNIAEHAAIEAKLPVGVFSLEMSAESLVLRMLCSLSRVNLRNVRDGFLAERDFPKLTNAAGKLANAPLFIDDSSGLSILQLRAKARRMHQQYGIKLFVIDYLQLLHSTARRAENRQQEIADISNGVKSLAKELDVPVIVLSQLNRELEKDKNRKPRLSDLRESGSIEQDADLVALLYKPTSEDEEGGSSTPGEEAVPVNLLVAKQRNGPTGDVNLTFLKSYTRFESAAKVGDEDLPN
jgi:replicative DNA helicase